MTSKHDPDDHPLAEAFDAESRVRGWQLFKGGNVAATWEEEDHVKTTVRDGATFGCDLIGKLPDIRARCDCWLSRNGRRCSHMFASLLQAEDAGLIDLSELRQPSQAWRTRLRRARRSFGGEPRAVRRPPAQTYQLVYLIEQNIEIESPTLSIHYQKELKSGSYGKPHRFQPDQHLPPTPIDETICAMLFGAVQEEDREYQMIDGNGSFALSGPLVHVLVPQLCQTGRLFVQDTTAWRGPYQLEEEPWAFRLAVHDQGDGLVKLDGEYFRGDQVVAMDQAAFILPEGYLFLRDGTATRINTEGVTTWAPILRSGPVVAPVADQIDLIRELIGFESLPSVTADGVEMKTAEAPQPRLVVHPSATRSRQLEAQVFFRYGDFEVDGSTGAAGHEVSPGVFEVRDRDAEQKAYRTLVESGADVLRDDFDRPTNVTVSSTRLPECVMTLLEKGWMVEAEGHRHRLFRDLRMSVKTGIDWFDLEGTVQFDDMEISLPEVLSALRKGKGRIQLGDGSLGVLPEDWLKQLGLLTSVGRAQKKKFRFSKSQGWVLDALLAAREQVEFDIDFEEFRQRLRSFDGLKEQHEEGDFHGELRDYQRVGLGWFDFLGELGLGGCLADDMGLGKTIQVLALIERLRHRGTLTRPALVVAPRSVVPNWISEAERFTPRLRVLDHTGPSRHRNLDRLDEYDLILTTYGALRSDAVVLKDIRFSYAILDEAQAIKNESSQTAKAARLLQADHRLALSGTPIENHLGELWSLFEFLNPGMLGRSKSFQRLAAGKGLVSDKEVRASLRRALRPFILRRTKEQVESSLPERLEHSILCDLEGDQLAFYNGIRAQYRNSIAAADTSPSAAGAFKMHVLEALLRLRQAACHPGLIDPTKRGESSTKLDALMPMVLEVIDEGHKALLFSQFTNLLDILEDRVKKENIGYVRLDGSTRRRQEKVDRFQTDPECPLFLISLKAGGVGINLTAADYVFILDPWWNPAAEAQAIDRAHRIGQTRRVMAYRLIARNTVEEKILELQTRKRELVDAILTEDNSVLKELSAEDLEFLLS